MSYVRLSMVSFTCIFVTVTLALSAIASLFIVFSLFSNEWEVIGHKDEVVEEVARNHNHSLQWLQNRQVVRIDVPNNETGAKAAYLLPAHGGVSKLCVDLSDSVIKMMRDDHVQVETCISYLIKEKITYRDSWLDRMRNLAMSCAIVCLILLACSAPLGLFGLFKKQISTIMVTGVMYSLAAVFGIFNLVFMRYKRVKSDGIFTSTMLDTGIPEEYLMSRVFTPGWPHQLQAAGLGVCLLASVLWLLLAKIFRYIVLAPT